MVNFVRNRSILVVLAIYICATTCIGEIFKIPVLLSHFSEHQANNSDITFDAFIYQHYQDDDGDDSDNDRDEQLPFKSPDSYTISVNSPTLLPFAVKISFVSFVERPDPGIISYKEPEFSSPYLSRIWQPPKFS